MPMETTVKQTSPVEYELEITASADELQPEVDRALRAQRGQTQAKGFRPGKVPLSLVKKLYGEALAFGVAEQKVQKVYEDEVLKNNEYEVVGQPVLTQLDYRMDEDLKAVIRFGVRPEVDLADLSGEKVTRLKMDVTDELVEEQIQEFRLNNADLAPTEEPAGDTDQVVFDVQEIDTESNTPIIGKREEDREFFLDDENLTPQWKEALIGKKAGDTFRVDISHAHADHEHLHRYEVSLKEVKHRDLPELDDETVKELTKDQVETVDALRDLIREQMTSRMEEQSRELFESQVVRKMIDLHPIPVPQSAVELYLDSFLEDIKQRNQGKLPEDFDEELFRQESRGEAEQQARWMFIRDRFIRDEGIEVTDEDLDAYFDQMSQDEQFSPSMLKQYYEQMGMLERVRQQLLSRKVFEGLAERLQVEELGPEEYAEVMKEQEDVPARAEEVDE